ncbi:hypothetical protein HDN1F_00290 [gamma proteobacterium HdN1]|nr:hypothetical protein HDN1F_00290 [gamma proteobacterium HdN1]
MNEEVSIDDLEEPSDTDLTAESAATSDDLTNDEVIPAARKLPDYNHHGGVGDSEEAMQEGANLTVSAKNAERAALEEAMQRFLAGGGKIQTVPPDASARAKAAPSQ